MFLKLAIPTLLLCLYSLGTSVHAQEVAPITESGAINGAIQNIQEAAAEAEWQARVERSKEFRKNILKTQKFLGALRSSRQSNLQRRAEHRKKCYEDLRSANKYTRLSIALGCYRADITLNLEYLRRERSYVNQMPGVTEDTRALTLTRIDLLLDAMTSITTAIDSNVFESVKELEEAKRNLLTMYRQPKWLMITRLKAENIMTWTVSLITRIAVLADEYDDTDPEISTKLLDGLTCLSESDIPLKDILTDQESRSARQQLRESQTSVQKCISLLREANAMYQSIYEPEEIAEEQTPTPTISRRLLRRLTEDYRINE